MDGKEINIEVIKEVASGLQELREKMVFVGGATLSLYADDPAADAVRPTSDIDLSVSLAGYGEWSRIQDRLSELQFYPDPTSNVICRFNYGGITIDVMPDDPHILGFTNPWYQPGLNHSTTVALTDRLRIRILPVAYFLATKFSAYHSRGGDSRSSHDFEDIVYVTDNRLHLVEEIAHAPQEVREYLQQEYRAIWDSRYREEILGCHLADQDRLPLLEEKIEQIIQP
ncbi:nucleotidyl transferase AbiEii/AbiGii toxin family protein [Pontibacter qinzhouensis]|uniref:Nucleotidyl transferase AbiEii/AbiGii toxin family protein n=1 Tax=Pontibacter qinzhouensis TaxID=2603253 RepID=A0A5C8IVU3_9BACT|nr:nucleotidyl transferase AbiEii/AbiGii toxin family protein [Pontibacter qinzhouensis]TXK24922.1 nucleotidyl transferase AbiEii/AbiGii toxin family protein [Pontibacter qinzhouensis]